MLLVCSCSVATGAREGQLVVHGGLGIGKHGGSFACKLSWSSLVVTTLMALAASNVEVGVIGAIVG
jgi:hypothetical protein